MRTLKIEPPSLFPLSIDPRSQLQKLLLHLCRTFSRFVGPLPLVLCMSPFLSFPPSCLISTSPPFLCACPLLLSLPLRVGSSLLCEPTCFLQITSSFVLCNLEYDID